MSAEKGAPEAPLQAPPEAVWFGLNKQTRGGGWERCERSEWGPDAKWWLIEKVDPALLARDGFGPGVYRVLWRGPNKMRHRGYSKPFEVRATNGDAQPVAVATTPAVTPAPSSPLSALAALGLPDDVQRNPTAQFAMLYSIVRSDLDLAHERMFKMFELAVTQERSRTELSLQHMQMFYDTMNRGQLALTQQLARSDDDRREIANAPIVQQLQALSEQFQSLHRADDLDDRDRDEEERDLAVLSDNPNNLERAMIGFQNILQTPAGRAVFEALADILRKKAGASPSVPQQHAAE